MDEGYLNVTEAPKMPSASSRCSVRAGWPRRPLSRFSSTSREGIDFLGYRTLKHLLGDIGKSSFGAHETEHLATGVEVDAVSKPYHTATTLNST